MALSTRLLALALLPLLRPAVGQSGSGIIGFGISLYPDLCCQACHDSLSALYLNCTTFTSDDGSMSGMSMGMSGMGMSGMDMSSMPMGTTSGDCYASNTPWLQTMAYCIQSECDKRGYPADAQAVCFSNQAVAGASTPTFAESLPATAPTTELAADAMWLNETSLVNSETYVSTYGTYYEFKRQEELHTTYSVILYLITIGAIALCGIAAHMTALFPTLQKSLLSSPLSSTLRSTLTLPALLNTRRHQPLPGLIGYIPSSPLSIFISLYILLNILFSAINFSVWQPNIFWLSAGFELCEYIGNRTGILSLVNASLAILFAGRNNLLLYLTGWPPATFLTLHRWAARVATLQAVVHSIVYTLAYWQPGYNGASAYAAKAAEAWFAWGIVTTLAFCLAGGVAVLPLRARWYEIFLVAHIVLVVVALVGCWYHLVPHFTTAYGYQTWIWICVAFWAFDRAVRLVRVLVYTGIGGDTTARMEKIPGSEVVQLTVFPRVARGWGPGQHSFLYFPSRGMVWENHPFSVVRWGLPTTSTNTASAPSNSSGSVSGSAHKGEQTAVTVRSDNNKQQNRPSVTFLIRPYAGATSWLARQLADMSVWTEGPYGGHRASHAGLLAVDTVVCVAGGIGITSALGYVHAYSQMRSGGENKKGLFGRTRRFVLAWSAREVGFVEHVRREFVDEGCVEGRFWCTGRGVGVSEEVIEGRKEEDGRSEASGSGGVTMGRMDVGEVIRGYLEKDQMTTVMVCGPGGMMDEATRHVVQAVREGYKVDLIEEAYTW